MATSTLDYDLLHAGKIIDFVIQHSQPGAGRLQLNTRTRRVYLCIEEGHRLVLQHDASNRLLLGYVQVRYQGSCLSGQAQSVRSCRNHSQ
jgi:hypothetical protein